MDVHPAVAEAFEECGGDSRVGAHADADDAELGDAAFFDHLAGADFLGHAVDDSSKLF